MKKELLLSFAAVVAISLTAISAQAVVIYDLENSLDGFGPNGGGVTISADTIGATNGPTSMKVEVVGGASFVGALTGTVPAPLGDPPGVDSIVFDLTIDDGDEFAGAFAAIGITIFGATQPDYPGGQLFGLQSQFADFVAVESLTAGTHEITLDLASATHPTTFVGGQSFNEIFGGFGTGANDIIPTGFQFFLNKSSDEPITVYIDNVRTVSVPEPMSAALLSLAALSLGLVSRRR